MHNNKIYEKSIEKNAYSTIIDKVYRNSFLGTFAVARMIEYHKKIKPGKVRLINLLHLQIFQNLNF